MSVFHDVSPIRFVDEDAVNTSLQRALRFAGSAAGPSKRFDAAGLIGGEGTIESWARHVDEMVLQDTGFDPGRINMDALSHFRSDAAPIVGGGFPRDFEFVRTQIYEERRAPLTAMQFFPVDRSVPLGARSHTVRRSTGVGEAQIHRPGNEFPRARHTFSDERFGVAYVVCSVDVNFFDALTTDWAGLQAYSRDLRLAYRLVEERLNRIAWGGDAGAGLAGVLNYPGLAKMNLDSAFTDAAVPEDLAAELTDFANLPMITSTGTFNATQMLVSPRLWAFLFSRKHSTQGGTDTTIGKFFLSSQADGGAGIQRIRAAPELQNIGGAGVDGIFVYRDDLDSLGHVLIQEPTALPVYQSSPVEQTTVVFAATGGVVMPEHGNSLLGLVRVT
jgi:hypothetical protein